MKVSLAAMEHNPVSNQKKIHEKEPKSSSWSPEEVHENFVKYPLLNVGVDRIALGLKHRVGEPNPFPHGLCSEPEEMETSKSLFPNNEDQALILQHKLLEFFIKNAQQKDGKKVKETSDDIEKISYHPNYAFLLNNLFRRKIFNVEDHEEVNEEEYKKLEERFTDIALGFGE